MHQGEQVERFVTVVVRSVQQERVRWPHDVKYPIISCDRNENMENIESSLVTFHPRISRVRMREEKKRKKVQVGGSSAFFKRTQLRLYIYIYIYTVDL